MPDGRLLARHASGPAAPEHGGQLVPPLPGHAGSHAPDALAGRRRPAVPVPAPGGRHHPELRAAKTPGNSTRKQALIRVLRARAAERITLTSPLTTARPQAPAPG